MKIIIAAGGTGGHIYPGIALAEELSGNDILFIGSREGLEKSLVEFPIKLIHARGLLRKLSWRAVSSPFISFYGFFEAVSVLRKFRPDWVVVMGGYVSLPVVFAARFCRIPVLIHEQNVLPGVTNRICSRFARVVTLSFPESQKYMSGIVTGNPVRKKIKSLPAKTGRDFTVLVMGGSQGARSINQALNQKLGEFVNAEIKIIHISGTRDYSELQKKKGYPFYKLVPYLYNIEEALAEADLVVGRAGATAISEILVCGKPAVLIPFPYSSEGHQELNAKTVESYGAAVVLHDKDLSDLAKLIKELAADKDRLKDMQRAALAAAKPEAAFDIIKLLYEKN